MPSKAAVTRRNSPQRPNPRRSQGTKRRQVGGLSSVKAQMNMMTAKGGLAFLLQKGKLLYDAEELQQQYKKLKDQEGKLKDDFLKKPLKLVQNFRSHARVIELGNGVLRKLIKSFPGSFDKLPEDAGFSSGYVPKLIGPNDNDWRTKADRKSDSTANLTKGANLRELLRRNPKAFVLFPQEPGGDGSWTSENERKVNELLIDPKTGKPIACDREGKSTQNMLGIRDSKGLEFPTVVLVNFFSQVSGLVLSFVQIDTLVMTCCAPTTSSKKPRKGSGVSARVTETPALQLSKTMSSGGSTRGSTSSATRNTGQRQRSS